MEHIHNLCGRPPAEELAFFPFLIRDFVPVEHTDKIVLGESRKGGFAEVRIGGNVVVGPQIDIGKIASTTA